MFPNFFADDKKITILAANLQKKFLNMKNWLAEEMTRLLFLIKSLWNTTGDQTSDGRASYVVFWLARPSYPIRGAELD